MGSDSLLEGRMICEILCEAYEMLGLGARVQEADEAVFEGERERESVRSEPSRVNELSVGICVGAEGLLGMQCEDDDESCGTLVNVAYNDTKDTHM